MPSDLTKAQAQRVLDLTTYCQRLAAVMNVPAIELLEALAMCNLTLMKDEKDVVSDHQEVIAWIPHKGEAT